MNTATKSATKTRTPAKDGPGPADLVAARSTVRQQFVGAALQMTWQLAVAFLAPVLIGVWLDRSFDVGNLYVFIGLAVAVLLSIAVMWRTLQAANSLPVPKLSEQQKRDIRKSYDEDDE